MTRKDPSSPSAIQGSQTTGSGRQSRTPSRRMAINLTALAREGAKARIRDILAELAAILRVFPDAASAKTRSLLGAAAVTPRTRGPMPPAEREAVSVRMKAYWASRRAAATKE